MNRRKFCATALLAALTATAILPVLTGQGEAAEEIYGYQLMTERERIEHRSKMRNAKSAEERERLRYEHHEQMRERAEARGMTLPEEPPPQGMGKGMGPGKGQGGGFGRKKG